MFVFVRRFAACMSSSVLAIVVMAPLAQMLSAPARATTASDPPVFFPLSSGAISQDWSDTSLITTDDNWRNLPNIRGYTGENGAPPSGTNPQTVLFSLDGELDVKANTTNPSFLTLPGGVHEFEITDPTIGLKTNSSNDFPHIVIFLDATGRTNIRIQYDVRDLDASSHHSIQPVALQYRINGTDPYYDVPAGFVADATTGPGMATLVTHVDAVLPAAVDNVALLQVRIMTANPATISESIGIDNLAITSDPIASATTTTFIELPGLADGGGEALTGAPVTIERCISFAAFDCDGIEPEFLIDLVVAFADGSATVDLGVDPETYECLEAVDALHSLLAVSAIDSAGEADFTGGNAPRQGNLNADAFIDILDFGLFVGAFGGTPPIDTDCDDLPVHADFTGDGVVNVLDYSILQANFFEVDGAGCCASEAAFDPGRRRASAPAWTWQQAPMQAAALLKGGPVTSISIQQLRAMGLHQAIAGDLNRDRWLDLRDMNVFVGGR